MMNRVFFFFHDKKRLSDTRSYVRCSIGVGSFTNNGSGVNDPNNPYLILVRSSTQEKILWGGSIYTNEEERVEGGRSMPGG